jgi:SAM-dependent methyltransferase
MSPVGADVQVAWHDVECGAYTADLRLWRDLAAKHGEGGVLDLGSGTGRVALDLAARGHEATAVEIDPELARELHDRAASAGVAVRILSADARTLALEERFGLVLAPMQMVQLMGGAAGRGRLMEVIARHLALGGCAALALAGPVERLDEGQPLPLPDVREVGGWVFSSTPSAVHEAPEGVYVERRRRLVSPDGEVTEDRCTVLLERCSAEELEAEAAQAGLRPLQRIAIPETADHVGSVVVVLEPER